MLDSQSGKAWFDSRGIIRQTKSINSQLNKFLVSFSRRQQRQGQWPRRDDHQFVEKGHVSTVTPIKPTVAKALQILRYVLRQILITQMCLYLFIYLFSNACIEYKINDHEQHIRAASCGSRLESQWETPNFDPPVEPTLLEGRVENWQDYLPRGCDDTGKV